MIKNTIKEFVTLRLNTYLFGTRSNGRLGWGGKYDREMKGLSRKMLKKSRKIKKKCYIIIPEKATL